jgi:hypothetical protein
MQAGADSACAIYDLLNNVSPQSHYHAARECVILRYEQSIMLQKRGDNYFKE